MNLKSFLAALCAVSIFVHSFTPPGLATNNDCTQEHPCKGFDRREG